MLCYHGVRKAFEPAISSIPLLAIARQLDYLLSEGWVAGNTQSVVDSDRCLAVTLDDALESQVETLAPVLSERGFNATLFVPTGFVGQKASWDYYSRSRSHASWSQLDTWCRAGHTIGSHGIAHQDLRSLSDSELHRETRNSRSLLEDRLGVEVSEFSYPFGRFDARVVESVRQAGYLRSYTTDPRAKDTGPWCLPRLVASLFDTPLSLRSRMEPTVWGNVERGKQRIISYWAAGTTLLPHRTQPAL